MPDGSTFPNRLRHGNRDDSQHDLVLKIENGKIQKLLTRVKLKILLNKCLTNLTKDS